ncbi:MAG: uroporphyrinogen decarboxylase [Clostridia bacterium]|nr:uroporphyrinogen decarboxylase [Clostridia bacterium]
MTGKELIQAAYRHESTPRPPWVPYAGIHAAKFKGYTATEILKDADKLYECLMEVHRLYRPDGQPIAFDLQLEAEVLGCDMIWADDNPPSVTSHPLEATEEIPDKFVGPNDGRIPLIMDVTRRMKESVGDTTALFGLFCGPFTLASHLRGTKLFMDMKKNPEQVRKIMDYVTENGLRMVDYYIEAGADIITPVDPLVSQISAKNFREYLAEPYTRIFEYIRSKGYQSAFFVCGNALRNIEEMCLTKPDGISIDENIPMATAKEITDRYNVTIGGNIPLTTTMLFGNQQDNMKYVVDMVDSVDPRNLVIAPGCDMPYDVPIENGIAVAEAARNIEMYREMLKNYESTGDDFEVELADYDNLEKPLIEAMTLDSAQCAACGYMWAVVQDAKAKYGDKIDVVEYKYSTREGVARSKKMGVKNLPSLYMNGKLYYSSIIPSQDEFFAEIEKLMK